MLWNSSNIRIKDFEICPDCSAGRGYGWKEIAEWLPRDVDDFDVFLYIGIGPADDETRDTFHLSILSRRNYQNLNPEQKRRLRTRWKYHVVERYEWAAIREEIQRRLSICDRGNWGDSLEHLRQQFSWEFENMNKPAPTELH